VLLMSDSGEPTERRLLESGEDLRSDIIIKGQHHSGRSASLDFLERVHHARSSRHQDRSRTETAWMKRGRAR
jgi:beta-lactamase superfamily II metal-dependent hydrolase